MTKVYIVNKGCHDHSDAKRFGELTYLSDTALNRYATSNMFREFMPKLKKSSPDDYILLTGLSVMGAVACSIFAFLHGRINLLLYKSTRKEGEKGRYVERTIVIGDEE
jgi:hypothetical protein